MQRYKKILINYDLKVFFTIFVPRIDEEQIRNFHRQLNLEEEKWEVN